MTPPRAPGRPSPTVTPVTEPFWKGLAEDVLLLQRCIGCDLVQHYPRVLCRRCWSDRLEWVQSLGFGTVWTYTVVHRPGHPYWNDQVPFGIAIVELDEGPRLLGSISLDRLTIGLRVRTSTLHTDDLSLLQFTGLD